MIQTSDGMERSVTTVNTVNSTRSSKWSEDECQEIRRAFEKFPNLSMTNLSKYLLNQHNIQISVATLKKMLV
jgi:hypothetical protein